MTFNALKLDIDANGVACLALTRPHQHNALNAESSNELRMALCAPSKTIRTTGGHFRSHHNLIVERGQVLPDITAQGGMN
jgi:hypothetical protein